MFSGVKLDKRIERFEKLKSQKRSHSYIWYLILVLSLIYIVDELASNIVNFLQVDMARSVFTDLFEQNINAATSKYSLVSGVATAVLAFSMFYKPLADKFGRKPFLVINTFGMALAVFICSFARTEGSFILFWLGFFLLRFFVTPDEQVVYIIETVSEKNRAKTLGIIKGIAEIFLVVNSLLRMAFVGGDIYGSSSTKSSNWPYVFLTIAGMCFIAALIALLFAKETEPFINSHLEELKNIKENKVVKTKQDAGFINSLKYIFTNKAILFLCIATLLYASASGLINYYSTLFNSHRLASYAPGATTYSEELKNQVLGEYNRLLFVYPFTCGIITLAYGFVSDKIGRKKISIILMGTALTGFIVYLLLLLYVKPNQVLDYFLGVILGIFLGAFYSSGDSLIMMGGESVKTKNRVSVMTGQSLFFGTGQLTSTLFVLLLPLFGGNGVNDLLKGLYCIFVVGGCFSSSLLLLFLFVPETNKNKIIETSTI